MTRVPVRFFVGSLEIGGTERNVLHLARSLDPERFDVRVWCNYAGQPLEEEFRKAGVPCESLKEVSVGRNFLLRVFAHNLPYQWRLWRLLRRERNAVIHVFGFPMTWYVVLLGALAGARRMFFCIQDWDVWKKSRTHRLLDRLSSRYAMRILADGAGAAALACEQQGMDPDKMRVIYDGVDTAELTPTRPREEVRAELGLAPNGVAAMTIARLDARKKGQDVLLAAARDVHAAAPRTRIVLVGDGPDRTRLEMMAADLPEGARPVFAGFRRDLADMLNAADMLVIPSRWESVPKILLEAMWTKRPVVATRVGDIEEILTDEAGRLVPPNDPPALAEAISELARDPDLRARLGAAGRSLIEARGFTLDQSVKLYEAEYTKAFETE